MHIVFLADAIDTQKAGIHYYCVESLRSILKYAGDHKITIIKPSKDGEFESQTVAVPGSPESSWRKFHAIPQTIKKLNPDVVVEMAHMGPFNLPTNIKRVTVIHDMTPVTHPQYHRYKSRKIQQLFLPRVLNYADKVLTHAEATKQDLVKYRPGISEKISVFPLGKSEIFRPAQDASVLGKLELRQPYFLSVGTIEPRKNYEVLLAAYQQFREKSDQIVDLVIVGQKGWKGQSFYQALDKHPFASDIYLLDQVERNDLPALYSQCQAFVFPSLYEGFGLPLLEAMSSGALCISSDTSSLPEVGGDGVLYFDPTDSGALASLLFQSLDDENSTLKTKALQRSTEFSWDRYAKELLNVLESLKP